MPELDERAVEAAARAIARSPIKAIYERADDIAKVALAAYFAALDPAELVERAATWLHGGQVAIGWDRLTEQRRREFRDEARQLLAALGLFTPDTKEPT